MKKIILIDDEPLARLLVREYLTNFQELTVIGECSDGFEGVKMINELKPDLIFLDIQMPKINGFEMLEIISHFPKVIFTTAFDEYAIKAFETNAIDYLLKPFSQERFNKAIQKWKNSTFVAEKEIQKINTSILTKHEVISRIVVKIDSEILIIPTETIDFIEAYDDYVKIFVSNKFYLKKKTLNFYENQLDSSHFMRIHRSFILNIDKLSKIDNLEKNNYYAVLISGKKIPISRTMYSMLKEKLGI